MDFAFLGSAKGKLRQVLTVFANFTILKGWKGKNNTPAFNFRVKGQEKPDDIHH